MDRRTLSSLLAEAPLPIERVRRVGAALCDALAALHAEGRSAGGLIPEEIALGPDDAVAPLVAVEPEVAQRCAAAYLAPELARRGPPSTAGDLYGAGAVLFALLTGRPPFQAATPAALMVQHALEPPPSPRELRPEVPEALAGAILQALAKDPAARPESAAALREAVTREEQAPAPARALVPAAAPAATPPPQRSRLLLHAGAALALAAALGVGLMRSRRAAPPATAPLSADPATAARPAPAEPSALEEEARAPGQARSAATPQSSAKGGAPKLKRPARVRDRAAPKSAEAPPPAVREPAPPPPASPPPAPPRVRPRPAPPPPPEPAASRGPLLALMGLLAVVGLLAIALPLLPRLRRPVPAPAPATVNVYAATLPGAPPPARSGEVDPFIVGRYRCFARLGEGGMGMVYRAEHVELGRPAAVKVLLPHATLHGETVERFRREARLTSSIKHPNIVFIYDYGEAPAGLLYLAMEFIDGISLADVLDPDGAPPRSLPLPRALNLLRQIAGALEAAHGAGVVHRDLKPANVMLCQQPGTQEHVKVVDFGIARSLDPEGGMTVVGAVLGTPAYMSPEQAKGEPDLDARSDVYSLGLLAFRMLSGALPFREEGRTPVELIVERALLKEPPPPIRSLRPDLGFSGAFEAALLRALEPDRLRRTPSALRFIQELEAAA